MTTFNSLFYNSLGKTDLNELSQIQLDIYIRYLTSNLNFYYEDYIKQGQGILFETIHINHTLNCQISDYKCFCFEFRRDTNGNNINQADDQSPNLDEHIGQEYRLKYIVFYIIDIFEKYIVHLRKDKEHSSQLIFNYVSFLFEILKISTKSFSELYSFQNKLISTSQSLYDLYYTQILLERCNKTFEHFFKKPVIQNQRINIMSVVSFDEKIEIYRKKLSSYLQQIGIFYDFLCSNYLDLKEIETKSLKLFKQNKQLIQMQTDLFDIFPEDRELIFLSTIYNSVLDFKNRKIIQLAQKSKRIPSMQLLPSEKDINIFIQNSCVVYASFNTIDGKITKVSNSFESVYDIEKKAILGKTINYLIPKGLYGAHDDLMKNFRNKGTMNVIMKGARMVFGLNGRGYIIPLMIRLKLENIFGEFGVCSHLSKVNEEKDYVFFSNEGDIMDVSENLYKKAFSSNCQLNELRLLNINNVIPLSYGITELKEFNVLFYSILIVKNLKKNKGTQNKQVTSSNLIDSIVDNISPSDEIFNISFKMCLIPTSLGITFKFVEISSLKRETHRQKRIESVKLLQECIQVFLDLNQKKTVVFSEINNSKFMNKSQMLDEQIHEHNTEDEIKDSDEGEEKQDQDQIQNLQRMSDFNQALGMPTLKSENLIHANKSNFSRSSTKVKAKTYVKTTQYSQFCIQQEDNIPLTKNAQEITSISLIINQNQQTNSEKSKTPQFQSNQPDQISQQNINSRRHKELSDGEIEMLSFTSRFNEEFNREQNNVGSFLDSPNSQSGLKQEFKCSNNYEITSPKENFSSQIQSQQNKSIKQDLYLINAPIQFEEGKKVLSKQNEPSISSFTITPLKSKYEKKVFFSKKEIEPIDEQQQFRQEQQNTYKVIMQNQIQINEKEKKEKVVKQSISSSQTILANYNKTMKNQSSPNIDLNFNSFKAVLQNSLSKQMDREPKTTHHNTPEFQKEDILNNSTQCFAGEDDENLEKDRGDIQSIRSSSQNVNEGEKRNVIKKIKYKGNTDGLKFFIIAGVFSFTILNALICIQYTQLNSTLNNFYDNFQILGIFNISLFDVFKSISTTTYRIINEDSTLQLSPDQLSEENEISQDESQDFRDEFQEQYFIMISHDQQEQFSQIIIDQVEVSLVVLNIEDNMYDHDLNITMPILYLYSLYLSSLNNLVDTEDQIELRQMWSNYDHFYNSTTILQTSVENEVKDQFDSVIQLQYANLYIILGVSLLLGFTLIPLSILIKQHKEKMLKLFGSFQPEKIQKYIDIIELCIQSIQIQMQDTALIQRAIYTQAQMKKNRNSSQLEDIKEADNLKEGKDYSDLHNSPRASHRTSNTILLSDFNTKAVKKSQVNDSFNQMSSRSKDQLNGQSTNNIVQEQNSNVNSFQQTQGYLSNYALGQQNKGIVSRKKKQSINLSHLNFIEPSFHTKYLIKRQPNRRARSIAFFSSMRKIGKVIIFSTFLILLCLVIFPVINIIVTQQFKKENNLIISERIALFNVANNLFDLQANHYSMWLYSSIPYPDNIVTERLAFHYEFIQQLSTKTQETLDLMNHLLDNLKDHTFDQKLYYNFFEKMLSGNLCSLLEDNIQYFDERVLDYDCNNLMSGILQRGIIVTLKQVYQYFNQFQTMYSKDLSTMEEFIEYLNQLQNDNDFRVEFDELSRMLDHCLEAIQNFLIFYQDEYYHELLKQQIIIFCVSIIITLLLFSVGWNALFRRLRANMIQTKKLLTLFSIELIVENNFFLQYFKSHLFGSD